MAPLGAGIAPAPSAGTTPGAAFAPTRLLAQATSIQPPARGTGAGSPQASTAVLERSWQRLDRELQLLDGVLSDDRQDPPLALPTAQGLEPSPPQDISLEQALAIGFAQSPELQIQRLEVAAALALLQARLGAYWPQLALVGGLDLDQSATNYAVPRGNESLGFGPNFAAGGAFAVPSGARAYLNQGTGSAGGGLELRYALLDFARAPAVEAARFSLRQARQTYANGLRLLQLSITEAYYQLQRNDELVRIREADLRSDAVVLQDVLALKQAGLVPRLDLLRRRAIEAEAEERLVQARADRAIARRRLAVLLNLPLDRVPRASDAIQLQPAWPLDLEASLLAAYRDNPELEALLAAREALGRQKDGLAAALLPRLSLVAGGGALGTRTSQWNASGNCCGSTVIPLLNTDGAQWGVGLTFRWLLFDGGSSAAEVRALASREAASAQRYVASRNDIRLRLESAFFNHRASLEKVVSARRAVAASLEAFRDARLRYQSGLSNEVTLSLTQDRLIDSLVRRLNATIDVNLTYAQLLRELLPVPRDPAAPLLPHLQWPLPPERNRSTR
ncbi:TolC family protein [Cyanobium sp. Morenito 9A2]|nr:TolC family protein [Cyanobium sp. Morenito 9A2]